MTSTIYEVMTDEMTWLARVLWPLTFGLAYCVTGLFMVVTEKLLKVETVSLLILNTDAENGPQEKIQLHTRYIP